MHKSGFNEIGRDGFCLILPDHFRKVINSIAFYLVQIAEKLEENAKIARNILDASVTTRENMDAENKNLLSLQFIWLLRG